MGEDVGFEFEATGTGLPGGRGDGVCGRKHDEEFYH